MTYIVMDLEFNYPETRYRSERNGVRLNEEITEIGAVKLDDDLKEVDRFQCYVKPTAYTKMNKKVEEVTDITTDMMWQGKPFEEAAAEFLAWCRAGETAGADGAEGGAGNSISEAVFITWSGTDIVVLEDNMLYHGMEIDDLPECYDIQIMFDDQITQDGRNAALSYAIWKLDIKMDTAHDALNDAANTAEVLRRLDLSEGLEGYEV